MPSRTCHAVIHTSLGPTKNCDRWVWDARSGRPVRRSKKWFNQNPGAHSVIITHPGATPPTAADFTPGAELGEEAVAVLIFGGRTTGRRGRDASRAGGGVAPASDADRMKLLQFSPYENDRLRHAIHRAGDPAKMATADLDAEYERIFQIARASTPAEPSSLTPARVRESPLGGGLPLARVAVKYSEGKVSDARNEDFVVDGQATGGLSGVFDGATDKSRLSFVLDGETVSGGRFASHVLGRALAELDPSVSARDAIDHLSAALADAVAAQHPGLPPELHPLATAVIYNPQKAEVWVVGDAQAGIEDDAGNVEVITSPMRVDDVNSARRARRLAEMEEAGAGWDGEGEDPGRAEIMGLLKVQGALANTEGPYGFGVLNGGRVPGEHLKVASVADARRIVLASDGYPQVAVEGRLDRGLAEDHLAALLKEDPRCVIPGKLQGTKCLDEAALREGRSFDDRSWLELTR
jgi:hypothetical protein